MKQTFEEQGWFKDNRKGLHCCFCNEDREIYKCINLYNHNIIKHIICEKCLYHFIKITQKYYLSRQRVQKAMDNISYWYSENYEKEKITPFRLLVKLREELGLNEQ